MLLTWPESPTVVTAFLASLVAGIATGAGALPLLVLRALSARADAALMGFSAGVMLAAAVFTLVLPALDDLERSHGSPLAAGVWTSAGLVVGAGILAAMNRYVPHEHFLKGPRASRPRSAARAWLLVLAITLHNLPEGLAVGVGVASGDAAIGLPVTLGIALQNAPEGLVVAVSLWREGYTRATALAVALGTGLVEPIAAVAGFGAVSLAAGVLPLALAFAAGAMIYVVSGEIIPESHRGDAAEAATGGTIAGFVAMLLLDVAFRG